MYQMGEVAVHSCDESVPLVGRVLERLEYVGEEFQFETARSTCSPLSVKEMELVEWLTQGRE